MEVIYPYIREGKFIGSFEVVCDNGKSIPCYNIGTARLIMRRIIADIEYEKSQL